MKRLDMTLIAALLLTLPASLSLAALVPHPGSGDPRILVVDYDPTQVVELRATLGYQTYIEFAPGERIENVAVGDATGWQITPNRAADLLFVKPMTEGPVTNMTVITNLRRYAFELAARPRTATRGKSIAYSLRFQYPEPAQAVAVRPPPPPPPPPPHVANAAYSYDGSGKILPARIFDDGRATYFQFREGQAYPAIFSTDERGEAVVNFYTRDGFVVADLVARGFVLRQGSEVTHIYNDGFQDSVPGPQSPKKRAVKHCWIFCL